MIGLRSFERRLIRTVFGVASGRNVLGISSYASLRSPWPSGVGHQGANAVQAVVRQSR
jgi:hypothetical protein